MTSDTQARSDSVNPVVVQVLADTDRTGRWTAHALELLGDAAKLAKRLGGLTGAWVLAADGAPTTESHAEGVKHDSPGHRPGNAIPPQPPSPERAIPRRGDSAPEIVTPLQGCVESDSISSPRAVPWAGMLRACGPLNIAALAEHGADVIQQLRSARFARWSSETVAAALAANTSTDCRAIFLPGTARGEEVAALLAEQLESVWIADVLTLSVTRTGTLEMTAVEPGGKLSRTYRAGQERPAIVTIRPGVAEAQKIPPPREPVLIETPVDLAHVPELTAVERHLPADPRTVDIDFAPRIVAGGRGTGGPDGMRVVERLAEVLGASLAASRMAVDLGWAPASRQVGQTGKTVRPDLYVACGISGASHHLAGMRDSRHIVAVNPDAAAPIHEVAHLSLHGDLHEIAPAVEAALRRRTS